MSGPDPDPDPAAAPPAAFAIALASLPDVGPARLRALLAEGDPEAAWRAVSAGRPVPFSGASSRDTTRGLASRWVRAAADLDPAALWQAHVDAGVVVRLHGSPSYPSALADDLEPPSVVFHHGKLEALASAPRVAVVGTRDCTRSGHDLAFELGRDLAGEGVQVVSGLALGIDGAAHAGAVAVDAAMPIGVVGSGLDVVYPRRNAHLWRSVRERGVLLSEHPLGTAPRPWHFPARNRVIAALADVVVVVESHRRGGAMHTVDEALARDRPIMAVPGSVRSRSSDGTNHALFDGIAEVCRDAGDVLGRLGLSAASRVVVDRRPPPEPADAALLDDVGWQPTTLEQVLLRTGRPLGETALALERLEAAGWLVQRGGWYERAGNVRP